MRKLRHEVLIIGILCIGVLLPNCAGSPVTENCLSFADPDAEKRVGRLREQLLIDPDDVETYLELGRMFLSEGMMENAIRVFDRALGIDPERVETLLLLSLSFRKLPKPNLTKSFKLLKKACEIEPENADVHLNLGLVYSKLKQEDKAINEFNYAVELSDNSATLVSAHLGLMATYKKQGALSKAQEEYEAAYALYPRVEEMIKQAEISRIVPAPEYPGEDALHPPFEERLKRVQEEIRKISGEDE